METNKSQDNEKTYVQEFEEKAQETMSTAKQHAEGVLNSTTQYIRANPLKIGFMALGVGVLLGMLVRHRQECCMTENMKSAYHALAEKLQDPEHFPGSIPNDLASYQKAIASLGKKIKKSLVHHE